MQDIFQKIKITKKESIQKIMLFLEYKTYSFKRFGVNLIYDPQTNLIHHPEKNKNYECNDEDLDYIFKKLYSECHSRVLAEEARAEELRIHHKILLTTGLLDCKINPKDQ